LETATDAPADNKALHPLLIYSHGAGGDPMYDTYLLTRLASQGFVVAAPLHRDCETESGCGPTGEASSVFGLLELSRPADVEAVIEDILQRSTEGDPILGRMVDPERIGMLGHSLGGWTSIRMLSVDARIRAVLALAPARPGALTSDIMRVARPLMVLIGDQDSLYDRDANMFRAIPASAPERWFGAIHRANHLILLEMCYALPVETPCDRLAPQSETATSVEQAGIAFLQVFVAGDDRFRPLLDPSAYGAGMTLVAVRSGSDVPALPTPVR
jgi:predicted dienelactone hydrolase